MAEGWRRLPSLFLKLFFMVRVYRVRVLTSPVLLTLPSKYSTSAASIAVLSDAR
jgi:hypothetical protein